MKKVEAVIQPNELDDVAEALSKLGIPGIIASDVRDYAAAPAHKNMYRGVAYEANRNPKVKLEMLVPAFRLEEVCNVLSGSTLAKSDRITIYEVD